MSLTFLFSLVSISVHVGAITLNRTATILIHEADP